jgi:hypothetical protein
MLKHVMAVAFGAALSASAFAHSDHSFPWPEDSVAVEARAPLVNDKGDRSFVATPTQSFSLERERLKARDVSAAQTARVPVKSLLRRADAPN